MSSQPPLESLSLLSLRVELHRRHLPTCGLKPALLARLSSSLTTSPAVTVPATFPARHAILAAARKRAAAAELEERLAKRARLDVVGVVMAGGASVWVCGREEMDALWGVVDGFGKGSLSRSEPIWRDVVEGVEGATARGGRVARQMAEVETETVGEECLKLSPVEAFLAQGEGRMRIVDGSGERLGRAECWEFFCRVDKKFARMFACVVRYREAGWVPRSGLKYGVDLVLYEGRRTRHAHAPYCVVLQFEEGGVAQSFVRLQTRLRLIKNVAKRLVIATVRMEGGEAEKPETPEAALEHIVIKELTVDRWVT